MYVCMWVKFVGSMKGLILFIYWKGNVHYGLDFYIMNSSCIEFYLYVYVWIFFIITKVMLMYGKNVYLPHIVESLFKNEMLYSNSFQ